MLMVELPNRIVGEVMSGILGKSRFLIAGVAVQICLLVWVVRVFLVALNVGSMSVDRTESFAEKLLPAICILGLPIAALLFSIVGPFYQRLRKYGIWMGIVLGTLIGIFISFGISEDIRTSRLAAREGFAYHKASIIEHILVLVVCVFGIVALSGELFQRSNEK
jgi:hypothetical protein